MFIIYQNKTQRLLGVPHLIVGNTFPRLAVKTVACSRPLVGKTAGDIGPIRDIEILTDRGDALTDTRRPQLIIGLP